MLSFSIYQDNLRQYRWRLKASNGQIIADSGEGYINRSDCQHAISLIKQYAPAATVQ
ncbi:MAG: DUF1508 domain-containing protein [Stenomitos rutilans HA7619-LM2]|jgi:uncharacterized protein YegP (UPF0339 family)|nr:DUF1508 domain-containing protein [Stenomitos rutilans HA7619-LM2]